MQTMQDSLYQMGLIPKEVYKKITYAQRQLRSIESQLDMMYSNVSRFEDKIVKLESIKVQLLKV